MSLEPQQPRQLLPNNQSDPAQFKLNQSLLTQSNFILFVLIFVSLLVNATHGYDYNVAIGCGIYFLSTKNHFLFKMFYFYMLIVLTIVADALSISLLYKKMSIFHWLIAPVLEIILKLILIGLQGYRWFASAKYEKQRLKLHEQQQAQLREQIQKKRVFQMAQKQYLSSKRDKPVNPSTYYQGKKHYNLQNNYRNQAYKQFDYQQFMEEQQLGNKTEKR